MTLHDRARRALRATLGVMQDDPRRIPKNPIPVCVGNRLSLFLESTEPAHPHAVSQAAIDTDYLEHFAATGRGRGARWTLRDSALKLDKLARKLGLWHGPGLAVTAVLAYDGGLDGRSDLYSARGEVVGSTDKFIGYVMAYDVRRALRRQAAKRRQRIADAKPRGTVLTCSPI